MGRPSTGTETEAKRTRLRVEPPFSLLAELSHRCPLHCPYCSNPLDLARQERELRTDDWLRVLDEAAELGVVEVHFSGGEPLLRDDLEQLVARATELEMYSNLITSGIGLSRERANNLKDAGLANVQVSYQAADAELANRIGGYKAFDKKGEAVAAVKEAGLHLALNVVLHRLNLDQFDDIIDLAESLGAERLELANTQYYNWALVNRDRLLPSWEQIQRAERSYNAAKARLKGKMEIIWVIPDYYESTPKPCMSGWGSVALTCAPDGTVIPCPTATMIKEIDFPNVKRASLHHIWYDSDAFNEFRGDAWMPEPCSSCELKSVDGGGCRCQAYALTGDAAKTDPACQWAPDHHLVEKAVQAANADGHEPLPDAIPVNGEDGRLSSEGEAPLVYRGYLSKVDAKRGAS